MRKIIYVPTLHPSLAPKILPDEIVFVNPGLDSTDAPGSFTPSGLPFAGRAATLVLQELLAIGTSFGKGGDLKLIAGQGWLEREDERKRRLREEKAALESFVANDGEHGNQWTRAASASELTETSQAEQFRNAQKALLLAWEHEECIIAMHELEQKITCNEKLLSDTLSDTSEEPAGFIASSLPPARPEYSWRIILDALSAFLPDKAILFTAYSPMIEDLQAQGILEPLPGDMVDALDGWPEQLKSSLLTAQLPLWRVLGYANLPQDRPWLGAIYNILAAPRLDQDL